MKRGYGASGVLLSTITVLLGCRGGEGGIGGGGAGGEGGGVSDATSLKCPSPGKLPFKLESSGPQDPATTSVLKENPRSKDEASDALGNPSGSIADTYIANDQKPQAGDVVYRGRKARTTELDGLGALAVPGEFVSLWYYDEKAAAWQTLGRTKTDAEGRYALPDTKFLAPNGRPIYSVLEADGTCVEHYDYTLPPGTKFVLTDIDGTMTLSDDELFKQIGDGSYVPQQNASADQLMNTWKDKGYQVVYLSARPHLFRAESRVWLDDLGFPTGPMITANSLVFGDSAREYKGAWVKRLTTDLGWEVVAAYGNAESDIQAYEDAGIPKDITFIVGEFAGASGTVAIENNDFSQHIADFVSQQPANQ